MEDKTLLMTMLFDFFGEILTKKQYEYFDLYHNDDLSLSEIAERAGISRQGVHDIITRAESSLLRMEEKTGVVKRWLDLRTDLEEAKELSRELVSLMDNNGTSADIANELFIILESLSI